MKKLEELKKIISEHKQGLEQKYKVKRIAIFGSYARNQQKEESDIDILVEFNEPVGLIHLVSLENYLSDILGIKTDVIPREDIRKELKDVILKEAIPVWKEV